MKNGLTLSLLALLFSANWALAQQPDIQYYRPWNKEGINVFEPSKTAEQPAFTGFKLRIGGAFTQDFQSLKHSNNPIFDTTTSTYKNLLFGVNAKEDPKSATLTGFNLAMANLNLDVQIADGIRVCLENYMSSRHHSEFWVKGGYIQVDKLPMFGNPKWYSDYVRVKIGHFQPNFGDMQFRRTDGGNTMFNPFVENYIFDAFSTEIGGELYVFPVKGFMGMFGMTSGFINGNINNYPKDPLPSTPPALPNVEPAQKKPSITLKLAYDNTFGDLRFRLSGSMYNNSGSAANTIFSGDRTGSHYFMVAEPSTGTTAANKDSGRLTNGMGISNKVNAISLSPFIKFKGLELFGTYDIISGRNNTERNGAERKFHQLAVEGLYRFLANEQAYIGARYIQASGRLQGYNSDITIDRVAVAAGWFPTKNMMLKGEYVMQEYKDFLATDLRNGAKFSGFMLEAVIGF